MDRTKANDYIKTASRNLWRGLLMYALVIAGLVIFHPPLWVILLLPLVLAATTKPTPPYRLITIWAESSCYILAAVYAYTFLGGWGILSIILLGIIMGGLLIARNWKSYMNSIDTIHRILWGEPKAWNSKFKRKPAPKQKE